MTIIESVPIEFEGTNYQILIAKKEDQYVYVAEAIRRDVIRHVTVADEHPLRGSH